MISLKLKETLDQTYARNYQLLNEDGVEVVRDLLTGLMWLRAISTDMIWVEALDYCADRATENHAGYDDWRLPNFAELKELVNVAKRGPASDFPNMTTDSFWSSTSVINAPSLAWIMRYNEGLRRNEPKTDPYRVRCVRSGP